MQKVLEKCFRLTTLDINNVPRTEKGDIDFKQDFFGKEANLTVSGQLNVETFATAFKNTYTFWAYIQG